MTLTKLFFLYFAFLLAVLIVSGVIKECKRRKSNKAYFKRIAENSARRDMFYRVQAETRDL